MSTTIFANDPYWGSLPSGEHFILRSRANPTAGVGYCPKVAGDDIRVGGHRRFRPTCEADFRREANKAEQHHQN